MDDFEKMDAEIATAEVLPVRATPENLIPGGVTEYREQLVRKYHGGKSSIIERLRGDGMGGEDLLIALIDEVLKETDNLLGNHLVAAENGNLRDASVISYKRAEVLEKAFKAYQSKQQFESENAIDLDSPSMMIIFRYFMSKVQDVFDHLESPTEQRDIFFKTLGDVTGNWKRELREEFEAMKQR